jgi:uncharacterized membrane protein
MADLIKKILLTMVVFLGIDFVWLGLVAKKFYDKELSAFQRTLNLPVALLDYVLIVVGIVLFVLPKASGNQLHAFLWGALFGLIGYGVYDLTNLATLRDWTLRMTVVDMLWGATVCGLVSLIVTVILKGVGN